MEVRLYTALAAPVAEWNGRGGKGAYRDGGMIAALHSPSPSPLLFVSLCGFGTCIEKSRGKHLMGSDFG
jgi:hypothetical protein